jgi:hypothetical protein
VKPNSRSTAEIEAVIAVWLNSTPFGFPVEPEVVATMAIDSATGAAGFIALSTAWLRAEVVPGRMATAASPESAARSAEITADGSVAVTVNKPRLAIGLRVGQYRPMQGEAEMTVDPAHSSAKPGANWEAVGQWEDIEYHRADGIAKITINRPAKRNAFRPQTVVELIHAFDLARDDESVGVVILTGKGDLAFCSGGDQMIRGDDGYIGSDKLAEKGIGRLNVLDLQIQIRRLPKPVIAMVAGYAIGGGHVLHVVCDLSIAAENAKFGQTGP